MDECAPENVLEVTARAITYYLDVSAECTRRIVAVEGAIKALCSRLVVVDLSSRTSKDLGEQCVKVSWQGTQQQLSFNFRLLNFFMIYIVQLCIRMYTVLEIKKNPGCPYFKSGATKAMNLVALMNPWLPDRKTHTFKCTTQKNIHLTKGRLSFHVFCGSRFLFSFS